MKLHVLEREQRLPIGIGEAWAFFSDAADLGRITPPDMGFRVASPPRPRPNGTFDHRRRVLEDRFGTLA